MLHQPIVAPAGALSEALRNTLLNELRGTGYHEWQ
jgi:hypothetical protein